MKPRKNWNWLLMGSAFILAAGVVVGLGGKLRLDFFHVSDKESAAMESPASVPAAPGASNEAVKLPAREAVQFRMTDLNHGWIEYSDGTMVTDDGGATWRNTGQSVPAAAALSPDGQSKQWSVSELIELQNSGGTLPSPKQATIGSTLVPVKQSQFLTKLIGWALPASQPGAHAEADESHHPLLVTIDGGLTWQDVQDQAVQQAFAAETEQLKKLREEAERFPDKETARQVLGSNVSAWRLFPESASRGDVVLVRHNGPGTVKWLGKSYTLEPFGAGYYTYLPITMQTKPGAYPIGDQTLTIKAKEFETQYLKVTEQLESMRQDTQRINADQKKIDAARSKSAETFLFSSDFIQPIEGILTTPYGYTRYVNDKFDSAHMAVDLAADEGTPVKATNDGIVALADNLYLTGNSVYIDHGMGLFSQYAHMSELRVKTGDKVKRGDIIGLVGTTGFSTGPHLHFTFWAHNVQANPNLFFNSNPFHWVKGESASKP
ncbi:M23 family metallopeptidase [Paenibacillus hexagrammi]|uniref:Peptidoglycan DD-metalloendopeptidase family protein n=1 Tax=Paenibacillus hexagrammi TaxID=2908839 RepID=A0ABY3SJR4_9BACL|nr:M23 family metallopeptidase [Paenibacillus sp. YPD9-1]UJF33456.1 peptidoglycan DD-metalloendopeptidase family protein [Paenibacillus sp. YPD9-1]